MNTATPDAPASTTIDLAGLPEPVPVVPDALTEARDELHREIMEGLERKWAAQYGLDREDAR